MKQYTVDFRGVRSYWDFYEALQQGLEFPDWSGKNPDAVWDLLTGYIEDRATITLRGVGEIPKDLEHKMALIFKVFEEASHYYGYTSYVIQVVD